MTKDFPNRRSWFLGSAIAALAISAPMTAGTARTPTVIRGAAAPTVSVYATGFNNPRGLKFGPDGMLYVAEGGVGGSSSTIGTNAHQVPAVRTLHRQSVRGGRISRVDSNGTRTTVNDRFPDEPDDARYRKPNQRRRQHRRWVQGNLYAITAGAGCSHGVLGTVNGVYRIRRKRQPDPRRQPQRLPDGPPGREPRA